MESIQIEASTSCNARCAMCPRSSMSRPAGMMKQKLFEKIVNEGMEAGVTHYFLFQNGEPLLFPKFFQWLEYLRDRNLTTVINTNGSMLDEQAVNRLNEFPNIKEIYFSMHAATKQTYEDIMGLSYEMAVRNATYLIRNSKIPIVRIYMSRFEKNTNEFDLFATTWGKHAFFGSYLNWAGARKDGTFDRAGAPRHPCDRVLNHMTVLWDGRVNLCCMEYDGRVILGDLNIQSVGEVWKNNQCMRDRHLKHDFDMALCRDCNMNRY